jgi:hypothetical protein
VVTFSKAVRVRSVLTLSVFVLFAITLCSRAAPAHAQAQQGEGEAKPENAATVSKPNAQPATADQFGLPAARARLAAARAARADASLFLPWLTVGVGAGSAALAGIAGAVHVGTCEKPCGALNWVAFAAVAGVTLGTLGVLWVVHARADLRELDTQRYHLERELERLELSRLQHEPGLTTLSRPRTGSLLNVRFSL